MYEIHRNPKKMPQPFEPVQFLPESMRPEQETASAEAVYNMLKAAFTAAKANN